MAIGQRTPDLAQSEGLRTVNTHTERVPVPILHDEARVVMVLGLLTHALALLTYDVSSRPRPNGDSSKAAQRDLRRQNATVTPGPLPST